MAPPLLLVMLLLVSRGGYAQTEIEDFVPTGSSETITAPLAVGGVLTTGSYNGLVRLDLSGSGTNNVEATDSYYSFERPLGTPVTPFAPSDGSWIAVGGDTGGSCLDFANSTAFPASNRTVFIDGVGWVIPGPVTIPNYSPSHEYSVVMDLQSYSGRLVVGNRDCGFWDNTGNLIITVTGVRKCAVDAECDDGNLCTDEICDPEFGCVRSSNSATCDDGDPCTSGDSCFEGECSTGSPISCPPASQCEEDGLCDSISGRCNYRPKPDDSPCDDGLKSTKLDICRNGVCVGLKGGGDEPKPKPTPKPRPH